MPVHIVLRKEVLAAESWNPSLPGDKVRVTLYHDADTGPAAWRIAVWGDDDTGMEMAGPEREPLARLYDEIVDGVRKAWLRKRGLQLA